MKVFLLFCIFSFGINRMVKGLCLVEIILDATEKEIFTLILF